MTIIAPRASRRDFIRLTSTMGLAAGLTAALAACGGGSASSAGSSGAAGARASVDPSANAAASNPDGVITAGISYELGTTGYDPMTTTAALTIAAHWPPTRIHI